MFERWVTPEDAELDLLRAARLLPAQRTTSAEGDSTPVSARETDYGMKSRAN